MTPDDIHTSTQTALAELVLTGCTTTADHLYIFPNGCKLDDEIYAGKEMGLRLHLSRGSMSLGVSQGGLPPDDLTEKENDIIEDTIRVIEKHHDSKLGSKLRIVVAPCSPFSVTKSLLKESAKLAEVYNVQLHTHLAETQDENEFCLSKFNCRPVDYMDEVGWLNNKAWFAHAVFIDQKEMQQFSVNRCGVAHCPSSNMRLSSGVSPIREMLHMSVPVGLGVDGSASNDSSNMLAEVRQSFLLARLATAPKSSADAPQQIELFGAREALKLATRGGAEVLGRDDIGSLEIGKYADFFSLDLRRLEFAGVARNPAMIPAFLNSGRVDSTYVGGQAIVRDQKLVDHNEHLLAEKHNFAVKKLLRY